MRVNLTDKNFLKIAHFLYNERSKERKKERERERKKERKKEKKKDGNKIKVATIGVI